MKNITVRRDEKKRIGPKEIPEHYDNLDFGLSPIELFQLYGFYDYGKVIGHSTGVRYVKKYDEGHYASELLYLASLGLISIDAKGGEFVLSFSDGNSSRIAPVEVEFLKFLRAASENRDSALIREINLYIFKKAPEFNLVLRGIESVALSSLHDKGFAEFVEEDSIARKSLKENYKVERLTEKGEETLAKALAFAKYGTTLAVKSLFWELPEKLIPSLVLINLPSFVRKELLVEEIGIYTFLDAFSKMCVQASNYGRVGM